MRNVISRIISAALAISLPLAISSCKQEEEAKEASIALKVTGTTTESVTFEITTENAATYSYAFAKSSETGSAEYVTEDAQNGAAVKIEKSGLEAETEYTIKAYATNSDGKDCAEANATALTTARATVSIESVSVTPESITFKVAAMNAASVRYAVAGPGEDAETVELSKETEGVPEQEFTEESLEPGTNYTVVASATNEAGEESERAYLTARTDIEPVIEVTEIVPESDQAKVTVSVGEAVQFAWACTEKGAEIPDRDSFNRVTISENVNSFIVSDLEENTDYVLSIFGITRYNYEGIIHSEDFTTQEHIEKRHAFFQKHRGYRKGRVERPSGEGAEQEGAERPRGPRAAPLSALTSADAAAPRYGSRGRFRGRAYPLRRIRQRAYPTLSAPRISSACRTRGIRGTASPESSSQSRLSC